ncbi:MAG: sulfurtransferase TusA family protein [Cyanobacteria bacterium P01_H01_bin.74]
MMSLSSPTPDNSIDVSLTKCPLNFVKAKLALEKLPLGGILGITLLVNGDSALNIPKSFAQEGQLVLAKIVNEKDHSLQTLYVQRCK